MTSPILPYLPRTRAHATSIPRLSALSGLSERAVRAELHRLREEEHLPIVTHRGVYLSSDPEDVRSMAANLRSRAMSMLVCANRLEMAASELSWSPTLFPVEDRGAA